jgi:hypothetical protein
MRRRLAVGRLEQSKTMVLLHSSNDKSKCNIIMSHCVGRRRHIYFFVAAALALFAVTNRGAVTVNEKSFIRPSRDPRGLLAITSEYEHPIVLATLRAYPNSDRCNNGYNWKHGLGLADHGSLAKLTVLSESSEDDIDFAVTSLVQLVGEPEKVSLENATTLWKTQFQLYIGPPPSFYFSDDIELCYTVDYRVEYVDFDSAMADFPSATCSFVGRPAFHRPFDSKEFRFKSQPAGNWLVRKIQEQDWEWVGNSAAFEYSTCLSWKKERPYSIAIIGDSQPSYTCHHLVYGITGSVTGQTNVRCEQIKQTLQNSTTFDRYALELQNSKEDIVIFNPSGLWEAAYGTLADFRDNFQRLLAHIPTERSNYETFGVSSRKQHYFFAPTTAVHPINYPDLPADDKKWSMTQPRVHAINAIAKDLVNQRKEYYKHSVSLSTLPAPWDLLSLNRDDDPLTPTDMRHFDFPTNEMLLQAMLCQIDRIWGVNA